MRYRLSAYCYSPSVCLSVCYLSDCLLSYQLVLPVVCLVVLSVSSVCLLSICPSVCLSYPSPLPFSFASQVFPLYHLLFYINSLSVSLSTSLLLLGLSLSTSFSSSFPFFFLHPLLCHIIYTSKEPHRIIREKLHYEDNLQLKKAKRE